MPWYDRTPSVDDMDFWKYEKFGALRLVSHWPEPNTIRINPRYRLKHTFPTLIPCAARYGLVYTVLNDGYDPLLPDRNGFGWFDFPVRGDNHFGVTTPVNQDGYQIELDIESDDDLPLDLGGGVRMTVELTHPTFGTYVQKAFYVNDPLQINWLHNMNTWFWRGVGRYEERTVPAAWPWQPEVFVFGAGSCYEFPQTDVGMAAFNGSDAYIKLTNVMTFANNPFKMSCEVRLNQTINHWPILGRDLTGGFFGMEDDDIVFGNLQLDTSWTPLQDVWLPWVYEFEPVTQLQHKLTIDGTVVRDSTNSRQNTPFDTIGVYRHGVSGTLWADLDLRDLKIEIGTPGNYTTKLDMPLRANALDLGPELNHGTTFNMPLPSV